MSERTAWSGLDWPVDGKRRIVPDQSAVARRRIEVVYFVGDDRVGFQRAEPVGEASRNKQLLALLGRQCHPFPAPVSGRPGPQIDGDVVYAALHNPDKLGLGCGGQLEVQAADGPRAPGIRLIVLNKPRGDAGYQERPLVVGFDEISAGIRKTARLQQLKARQAEISDVHHSNELAKLVPVKSRVSGFRSTEKLHVNSMGYGRDPDRSQLREIPEGPRKIIAL